MPIKFVMDLSTKATDEKIRLTKDETDALVELLIEKDEGLLTIYRNFHVTPDLFRYYALRYVQRKPKKPPSPPNAATPPS